MYHDAPKWSSKTCLACQKIRTYRHNRAINYNLRRNRLRGFNVWRYTEIVLENLLGVSKNPHVQSKPSYKLWFATKSSPGLQRVEIHWNSPRKRAPHVEKPPGTVKTELQTMVCVEIVCWVLTSRDKPKQSSKTCSAGRSTPQLQLKPSYKLWFATKSSPGLQRVEIHWNSPRKRAPLVEISPGTVKT